MTPFPPPSVFFSTYTSLLIPPLTWSMTNSHNQNQTFYYQRQKTTLVIEVTVSLSNLEIWNNDFKSNTVWVLKSILSCVEKLNIARKRGMTICQHSQLIYRIIRIQYIIYSIYILNHTMCI